MIKSRKMELEGIKHVENKEKFIQVFVGGTE
jgi:hypothetical protein